VENTVSTVQWSDRFGRVLGTILIWQQLTTIEIKDRPRCDSPGFGKASRAISAQVPFRDPKYARFPWSQNWNMTCR